jgi:putative DNA primase/helicase
LCRHITAVAFDPSASCPLFEAVVQRAMGGGGERIRYLKLRLGSMLAGSNPEQLAVFFVGAGANSKGVIANAALRLLGSYGRAAAPDTFMARRNRGEIREDLVALEGTRYVVTSEANEADELDIATLKRMTGGDPIVARGGYEKMRQIQPTWKILMLTNSKPRISAPDYATWRRIEIMPFDVAIPEHERDVFLDQKLDAEAQGILRWLVEGCRDWYAAGCRVERPACMREALAAYQREEDPVRTWVMEECELHAEAEIGATAGYQAFAEWLVRAGGKPMSQTAFGTRLAALGDLEIRKGRDSNNKVTYRGVRLRPATMLL